MGKGTHLIVSCHRLSFAGKVFTFQDWCMIFGIPLLSCWNGTLNADRNGSRLAKIRVAQATLLDDDKCGIFAMVQLPDHHQHTAPQQDDTFLTDPATDALCCEIRA